MKEIGKRKRGELGCVAMDVRGKYSGKGDVG
jgi:hypothetical protein